MKKKLSIPIFCFLLLNLFHFDFCEAQVSNDSAHFAKTLIVNEAPQKSDTKNCTLEEKCIDRKLTAKCLVYHNDQWFTFTTGNDSIYYLYLQRQDCRDINGVQLQVLEGHLCKPSTYKLLECISLSTQDDVYLTLTQLKKNKNYILNVDGYLHDFCRFEIGITTTLPDFAVLPLSHLQDLNGIQKNGRVFLEWKLNEELESIKTQTFEVRRRFEQEKKFYPISNIPVERFVHGQFKPDYQYMDTVNRKGYYYYQVIAYGADSIKYLVGEYIALSSPILPNKYEQLLELPCKDKTEVIIFVYNWENNFLMGKIPITYYNDKNRKINLGSYFQPGILRLKLIIMDKDGEKIKEILIDKKN